MITTALLLLCLAGGIGCMIEGAWSIRDEEGSIGDRIGFCSMLFLLGFFLWPVRLVLLFDSTMRRSLFVVALLLCCTTAQAETIIASFTAPWCPYCQRIKPEVVALQKAGYDIRFADVDLPATKNIPGFNEVKQIPVALAIDTETMKVVDRLPNARMNPATLKAFVAKHAKPKPTK